MFLGFGETRRVFRSSLHELPLGHRKGKTDLVPLLARQ